jgi:predicted DNA-binding ribbon-helix-helix protein
MTAAPALLVNDLCTPLCVIFATLGNSFGTATVQSRFSVPLSLIYYNARGVLSMRMATLTTECQSNAKGANAMKSPVVKRSIVVAGHKTSVSLEDAFWKGLKEIAGGRDMTLSDLVASIDSERRHGNLSSAIRLFVLDFYRSQVTDLKAGREGGHAIMASAVSAFT